MCGIIGAIAERHVGDILLEGLRRLEYRGYDSAGLAIIDDQGKLARCRAVGKVEKLVKSYEKKPLLGKIGIAHTRWATHGEPSERNAHPIFSGRHIALVHNGIIENHESLRQRLQKDGYSFETDTDTEIIAHLVHQCYQSGHRFLTAVRQAVKQLKGAFALAILNADEPDHLIVARFGSPLVIGLGIGENFVASDVLALLPVTQTFIYLEEGDVADISRDKAKIYDKQGKIVKRPEHVSQRIQENPLTRGNYRHFMLKEIFEQASTIEATLEDRITATQIPLEVFGFQAPSLFSKVEHIQIVACGTSFHAGLVAKYWIEELAGLSCQVEVASEIRYRKAVVLPNTLFITISQSGETADTLAALKQAKQMNYRSTLAICNVAGSSLVRESDLAFLTRAGIEIGVASTKAFTAQLVALLILTVALADRLSLAKKKHLIHLLEVLPEKVRKALQLEVAIQDLAHSFAEKEHTLFLGRGIQYPIAMEGALKLKEISYIHAEAYPAGELKHGPLALIDKEMPVVAIAPNDDLLEKLKSNLQEVRARGGQLIVFADGEAKIKKAENIQVLEMPKVDRLIAPIVYTIPLQLLAYYVALIKGTDVDRPRNLAKSVTVE